MAHALERYRKTTGDGPAATIFLEDWNGVLDTVGPLLAQLVQKGADFDAVAATAIGVLLDRINAVLSPAYDQVAARGAQVEVLYAQLTGQGVSAASVIETTDRLFLTADRRAAILADLRGGVPPDGDTLAKLYGLIVALRGGADAAHDTLGELAALVDANMAAVTNRLRGDAAGGYTDAVKGQFRSNLIGAPATISTNGSFAAADVGRRAQFTGAGGISRTLPAISGLPTAMWATDVLTNNSTGLVTIAAAGADAFEGVAGGNFVLLPKQRAYVYLDTDGWHVGWTDRCPIVASVKTTAAATAAINLPLAQGYAAYEYVIGSIRMDTAGAYFGGRLSLDGSAYRAGASDYFKDVIIAGTSNPTGSNVIHGYNSVSFVEYGGAFPPNDGRTGLVRGVLTPGTAGNATVFSHNTVMVVQDGTGQNLIYQVLSNFAGVPLAYQLVAIGGNFLPGTFVTMRGIPAP